MNINKLIKEAHENAVDKGFWECEECDGSGKLRYHDHKEDYEETRDCFKCNGTGKHGKKY